MQELSIEEVNEVSGGRLRWMMDLLGTEGVGLTTNAVLSGRVDYAGLAEQQGSGYNMLGA